jgi:hypothetical protein
MKKLSDDEATGLCQKAAAFADPIFRSSGSGPYLAARLKMYLDLGSL